MPEPRTAEFTDAHGVAIVYDVHPAPAPARGVVQLIHGVGEHVGRYADVVSALNGAGFTVYAADNRGHGRTGIRQHGGPERLGRLGRGGMAAAVAAQHRVTGLIREENPGAPIILLGHSWGSFLAQMLLDAHPDEYAGLALSGSALRTPRFLNAAPLNRRWDGPDATGLEWLSRDPEVWRSFDDDPLTTDVPLLKLFGPIEAARLYGRPGKDLGHDIPVLLMVGSDDPVGGPRSVHRLADEYRTRSGLTDVTTLVYPDARHEIFLELQKDEVLADLLAWLDSRFPA